jgi:hypothetical protein
MYALVKLTALALNEFCKSLTEVYNANFLQGFSMTSATCVCVCVCVTLLNIRGSVAMHGKLLHVPRCSDCCTWGWFVPVLHHCSYHSQIVLFYKASPRPHWCTNSCLNAPCTWTVPLRLINCSTQNTLYSTDPCAIVKYTKCNVRLTCCLLVLFMLPTTQCCQLKIIIAVNTPFCTLQSISIQPISSLHRVEEIQKLPVFYTAILHQIVQHQGILNSWLLYSLRSQPVEQCNWGSRTNYMLPYLQCPLLN